VAAADEDQQRRARVALANTAWAYGEALEAGDLDRASQLLALFQGLYSSYRSALISAYPEEVRGAVEEQLPARLTPSGVYDAPTRRAATAAFSAFFGGSAAAALREMPTRAADFSSWFTGTLQPAVADTEVVGSLGTYWDLASRTPPMDIPETVGGEAEAQILGLEEPPPTRAFALPRSFFETRTAARETFEDEAKGTLPEIRNGKDKGLPTWGWVVMGTAAAASIVAVVWATVRKR